MNARSPSAEPLPGQRSLSPKELQQRLTALSCGLPETRQPSCMSVIQVGLFFDGTNNNLNRDKQNNCHSNIVRLYDSFPERSDSGYFRHYIPGVGTAFPEIGELGESKEGKAFAKGGESRLYWALIQVLNSMHMATVGERLIPDAQAKADINNPDILRNGWTAFSGKRRSYFDRTALRLQNAISHRKPELTLINLSVFGFSRGAAEARAFCQWLLESCRRKDGAYTLAGVPIRLQFLGLFDTVASVGLADSAPVVDGHFDWADGTMRIPQAVEQCVHFVAAHETRASFPLNTVRDGTTYPPNAFEVVYPGAHSDVGGGYAPGDQGRSSTGSPALLSQIPLLDMWRAARKAGVPLHSYSEMNPRLQADFELCPVLAKTYAAYLKESAVPASEVEHMLEGHMRAYRRYRFMNEGRIHQGPAYRRASHQDRQDLFEGDRDFQIEIRRLREREKNAQTKITAQHGKGSLPKAPPLSELEKNHLEDARKPLPAAAAQFFEDYVHDSHAGFYLAGPVTTDDKSKEVAYVRKRATSGKKLNGYEQRVLEADTEGKPFPVVSDADAADMLRGLDDPVVRSVTPTRREAKGYLEARVVFDKS